MLLHPHDSESSSLTTGMPRTIEPRPGKAGRIKRLPLKWIISAEADRLSIYFLKTALPNFIRSSILHNWLFIQSEKLFASKAKDLDLANGKLRAYP